MIAAVVSLVIAMLSFQVGAAVAKQLIPMVGAPGTTLDVPLTHINASYVRSHFDSMEVGLNDAPRADEMVLILAMTTATFYAFLSGAPLVLGSLGVGPEGIGWYIACIPLPYIAGNYLTARLVRRTGERRVMAIGQALTVAGLLLTIGLALAGWHAPLAFVGPLMLLGLGHGLLMPATLSGTVGVLPALAGAAAAVGGLMQQLVGATGAWVVGLVPHQGALNLGLLMLGSTLVAAAAQMLLRRAGARP